MTAPTSRKRLDFLARVGQEEARLKQGDAVAAQPAPRGGGFVGKALQESNARLDQRVADAERAKAESDARAEELERKIAGGAFAVKLDPQRIRHSPFVDRHPNAFADAEFESFVDEIRATGGNKEPGIVRPVLDDPDYDYELAAGHRRHAACLRAGLPYFAFVRELTDGELLLSMHTENRGRKDLSTFERGRHYAALLQRGLFPSARALAAAFNETQTSIRRLLAYGELTEEIIRAFPDPRAIRFQWIAPLVAALSRNRTAFLSEVAALSKEGGMPPTTIFKRLSGSSAKRSIVAGEDRILASVRMVHGRQAVVLHKDAPDELIEQIKELIEQYHASHSGDAP